MIPPAFHLRSPENGTDYVIYVHSPLSPTLNSPVPAVLFMDGDDQFRFAITAYDQLRRASLCPPLLLVGIGYGASYAKPANKRGRDYTPTPHSDEPTSGGADVFLAFLTQTLWPELARRFPVREDMRGIAGHSLGSLLALHALFREPLFFTHYLASAPSIWWDDRSILRLAAARRQRNGQLPAHLFLSVGESDTSSMIGDLALLEQHLAAQPFRDLRITAQRFPGRDHYNVIDAAFRAGLRALFGEAPTPGPALMPTSLLI